VYDYWHEYKTEKKPRFVKTQNRKRNNEVVYELALIFPNNRWATKTFVKDSLGRLIEAKYEDDKFRIKEIIPYWKEELIYDLQKKTRVRYHEILEQIMSINEIGQIFTLNNKLFVLIFVKDVSTAQRKILYQLLESKGFKKSELFRHYSY